MGALLAIKLVGGNFPLKTTFDFTIIMIEVVELFPPLLDGPRSYFFLFFLQFFCIIMSILFKPFGRAWVAGLGIGAGSQTATVKLSQLGRRIKLTRIMR